MGIRANDYWLLVGVSIWTILQTIIHVWWILHGRTLFSCHYEIRQKVELYIYYTYLYSNDCENNPVMDYISNAKNNSTVISSALANSTPSYGFAMYLQRDVVYPYFEKQPELTNSLMFSNFVMDVLWFVASVSLLVGTVCKLKEWSAVIFLSPWIVVDFLVLSLDLFGAIYFGLHIQKTQSDLRSRKSQDFEEIEIPNSAVMAIVSGRLGIIWLVNCLLLVFVIRATFRALKCKYEDENEKRLNTSREARIKNWQQFYGVIGEETESTFKEKSVTVSQDENIYNYSSTFKDFKEQKRNSGVNLSSTLRSSKASFRSTADVLKGHLPWSYTQNVEDVTKTKAESNKNTKILTIGPVDVEEYVSKF